MTLEDTGELVRPLPLIQLYLTNALFGTNATAIEGSNPKSKELGLVSKCRHFDAGIRQYEAAALWVLEKVTCKVIDVALAGYKGFRVGRVHVPQSLSYVRTCTLLADYNHH